MPMPADAAPFRDIGITRTLYRRGRRSNAAGARARREWMRDIFRHPSSATPRAGAPRVDARGGRICARVRKEHPRVRGASKALEYSAPLCDARDDVLERRARGARGH
jgi:hypothetical protein